MKWFQGWSRDIRYEYGRNYWLFYANMENQLQFPYCHPLLIIWLIFIHLILMYWWIWKIILLRKNFLWFELWRGGRRKLFSTNQIQLILNLNCKLSNYTFSIVMTKIKLYINNFLKDSRNVKQKGILKSILYVSYCVLWLYILYRFWFKKNENETFNYRFHCHAFN